MTTATEQNRPPTVSPEGLGIYEGLPVHVAIAYAQFRACARSHSPAVMIEFLTEAVV